MKIIADLHLHSKYSRAVSQQMNVAKISEWAKKKGIGLVATADWTHPIWLRELKNNLEEAGEGIYRLNSKLKTSSSAKATADRQNSKLEERENPLFLLSTELSCIYSQGGATRRIHILVFAPNFETVEKINKELMARRANLFSDGRPILGMSAATLAEIILGVDSRCLIVPAHAWTPWFSLYGSKSGFDSLEECFGNFSKNIYAIETGLSSDPAMNWRIEELTNRQIVSFSDAHSPQKLGREATVFDLPEVSYENVRKALVSENRNTRKTRIIRESEYQKSGKSDISGFPTIRPSELSEFSGPQIVYTIEFYPEEGKYHYTGHRNCGVVYSPNETRKMGTTCPVCGKPLTVGVMSRVEHLAGRKVEIDTETDEYGARWIKAAGESHGAGGSLSRRPYVTLVPLAEIISESVNSGVGSKEVEEIYENLVNNFSSEFKVLLETTFSDLEKIASKKIVEGIQKVRSGDIVIEPGYDGVFGKVKIWKSSEKESESLAIDQQQLF